jgi:hypothetical protein
MPRPSVGLSVVFSAKIRENHGKSKKIDAIESTWACRRWPTWPIEEAGDETGSDQSEGASSDYEGIRYIKKKEEKRNKKEKNVHLSTCLQLYEKYILYYIKYVLYYILYYIYAYILTYTKENLPKLVMIKSILYSSKE